MRVSDLDAAVGAGFATGLCAGSDVTFDRVLAANLMTVLGAGFGGEGFTLAFTTGFGAAFAFAMAFGAGFALTLGFTVAFTLTAAPFVPLFAVLPLTFTFVFAFAVTNFISPETTLSSFCGRSRKRRKHKNA